MQRAHILNIAIATSITAVCIFLPVPARPDIYAPELSESVSYKDQLGGTIILEQDMSAKLSGSKTLYWIDKRLKSRNFQNDTNAINYEAAEASQYVFFPNLELAATAISNSGQIAKWRAANREPVETSLIYPQKIREAISSAPPVYRCMYDRMSAYRKDILQETGWISPLSLLFWTAAPPDELGHVDKWRSQRRIDVMSMKPRKLSAVLS